MSHRNDVSWSDKDVRLPELEMLRLADKLRCPQNYEEAILILLELRPLVRAVSVLDGQVVEAKFFLNLAQQLLVRLVKANPDKSVFVFKLFTYVRDLHSRHAQTLGVGGAINYSRTLLAALACWQSRGTSTICLHTVGDLESIWHLLYLVAHRAV